MANKFFLVLRIPLAFLVVLLFLSVTAVSYGYTRFLPHYPTVAAMSRNLVGRIIVIDAGHGGFDPGAIGAAGTLEKDVTLAISRQLAELCRQAGAIVVETRTQDEALADDKKGDMAARVKVGRDSGAEFYLMIHGNAIPQRQYHGAQVFYSKGSAAGESMATAIQSEMTRLLQNTQRTPLKLENIYVMRAQSIPVIVVEVGFLSNPEEEKLLLHPTYQERVAWSIYSGMVRYYSEQAVAK